MKFSGYYLYMNSNIWGDFQICISVPLSKSVCRASEPMETLMLYIFPQKLLRIWNSMVRKKIRMMRNLLTLSWQKPLSYRNKFIDLLYNSMVWFLYDRDLRHERVNLFDTYLSGTNLCKFNQSYSSRSYCFTVLFYSSRSYSHTPLFALVSRSR